jgi:hypothetical protein
LLKPPTFFEVTSDKQATFSFLIFAKSSNASPQRPPARHSSGHTRKV